MKASPRCSIDRTLVYSLHISLLLHSRNEGHSIHVGFGLCGQSLCSRIHLPRHVRQYSVRWNMTTNFFPAQLIFPSLHVATRDTISSSTRLLNLHRRELHTAAARRAPFLTPRKRTSLATPSIIPRPDSLRKLVLGAASLFTGLDGYIATRAPSQLGWLRTLDMLQMSTSISSSSSSSLRRQSMTRVSGAQ